MKGDLMKGTTTAMQRISAYGAIAYTIQNKFPVHSDDG